MIFASLQFPHEHSVSALPAPCSLPQPLAHNALFPNLAHLLTRSLHQSKGFNYGFIEYDDPGAAERAMQTLNGRRVHQSVRYPDPKRTPSVVEEIFVSIRVLGTRSGK